MVMVVSAVFPVTVTSMSKSWIRNGLDTFSSSSFAKIAGGLTVEGSLTGAGCCAETDWLSRVELMRRGTIVDAKWQIFVMRRVNELATFQIETLLLKNPNRSLDLRRKCKNTDFPEWKGV